MPESGGRVEQGKTYRVEFDGLVIAEFTAKQSRRALLEGIGGATAFLSALPGNYDPSMKDTYSARPPAPHAAFRAAGAQRWQDGDWPWLFEQPKGVYFAQIADHGQVRITLDPED